MNEIKLLDQCVFWDIRNIWETLCVREPKTTTRTVLEAVAEQPTAVNIDQQLDGRRPRQNSIWRRMHAGANPLEIK